MTFIRPDGSLEDFHNLTIDVSELPEKLSDAYKGRKDGVFESIRKDLLEKGWDEDAAENHADYKASAFTQITPNDVTPVVEKLRTLGIRNISWNGSWIKGWKFGHYAFLIPVTNKKQLLRISLKEDEDRPYKTLPPMVLKPLTSFDTDKFHVEILPEVYTYRNPKYCSPEEKRVLQEHLHFIDDLATACGYLFYDIKWNNIGFLKNGLPVIIDPGSICDMEHVKNPLKAEGQSLLKMPKNRHEATTFNRYKENILKNAEKLGALHNPSVAEWHESVSDPKKSSSDDLPRLSDILLGKAGERHRPAIRDAIIFAQGWREIMRQAVSFMCIYNPPPLDKAVKKYVDNAKIELVKLRKSGKDSEGTTEAKILFQQSCIDAFEHGEETRNRILPIVKKLYEDHQKEHIALLGLNSHEVTGVFSDKYLNKSALPASLKRVIREHGPDRSAFGEACIEAASEVSTDNPDKWKELIEKNLSRAGSNRSIWLDD